MNTYKVDVKHESGDDSVHVAETTRERAVYKAFNELSDRGYTVLSMGDVSLFDDNTETWHVIPSHRSLSEAVG